MDEVLDALIMLYPAPDEAGLAVDHPLRILPRAGAAALRGGDQSATLAGWIEEHDGLEVIRMSFLPGLRSSFDGPGDPVVHDDHGTRRVVLNGWPGHELDVGKVLAVSRDRLTLVTAINGYNAAVWFCMDGFTPCRQGNPWCDWSEEPMSPKDAEAGPYRLICTVHHDYMQQNGYLW